MTHCATRLRLNLRDESIVDDAEVKAIDGVTNIAEVGFDYICPLTFACNFAVIGVAAGVFLKAKNQEVKSFSLTGVITIVLSAIIEPTLFGLLVNNKKLFGAQIVAGAIGGAYLGLMRVVTSAFVFGSVVTFPAFVNGDMMSFVNAMIGLGISTVVGAPACGLALAGDLLTMMQVVSS